MKKIILASGSPRRKELLTQIGITFEIQKAEGEEVITSSVPTEVVKELSLQKAQEVAAKYEGDVVIGADTVVAAGGQILGKPKDKEDAMRMLRMLQGKDHEVITGVSPGGRPVRLSGLEDIGEAGEQKKADVTHKKRTAERRPAFFIKRHLCMGTVHLCAI